ncbi:MULTISPECIES: xanthine dehydrogenase family protein molybdopterin-binding subunit [Rhizobium]|uniref:Carbon-monoxide dehydrogenase large subunit n=1 Tax=Rhizobium tropici TaxID=398 RepID=A0A6P1C693_RHITR|nr:MULTISPECIES: xanthine dehydrogenase family protein molybdopterin-binding subunit [Rhizobium]AGB74398.1 carbon monoxide dehydrogenase large chain [Rhizobium tropici CIAT 899]MBB4240879.1 carbon-monoxide dehydrogenase large subunit [Rhizobium tropici]MBB5591704.1 carbon-monoxide dehydrogenase large subunit [Rhizobium tropici]MBB6490758.1 carbon-monoxide dehydrogenase large subunit [Rhizobium tropici]NEV12237.1 xanthine dehydrogenase family protein molybdopterin-binding subunit [Rhizobium tro
MTIGKPALRIEDRRFLTGEGKYVDDFSLPRQCHAALVLSPHAHADILSIDISAASEMPGVIAVLTGADVAADGLGSVPPFFMPEVWGGPKGFATLRPILVADRVRCVGERVAVVIAETVDEARAAAEHVCVEYAPLAAVVDAEAALAEGAPVIWPENQTGNLSVHLKFGDAEKTAASFERASLVVSRRLASGRVTPASLEPRGCLGDYDTGTDTFTLYTSSQDPHGFRRVLASVVLKIPESTLRVVSPDVGGGFGLKAHIHPEDAIVLWASRRVRRPVKWIATRSESMQTDTQGRGQIVYADLALDADGKILGIRARAFHNLGAYFWGTATPPLFFSMQLIPGTYDVPTVDLQTQAVFTNICPMSVYRGAGRPEAAYAIERLMDEAAYELGIDPREFRRRNYVKPDQMPYSNPAGLTYDSGEFERLADECAELADWIGYEARKTESARRGRLRGRSITSYIEIAGVMNERMEVRFDPSGTLTIIAGTHSHGQGHATVFTQMVADWLSMDQKDIRFVQGDTDKVLIGRGTFAARSSMLGGTALKRAVDDVIVKASKMAALLLKAEEANVYFEDGLFKVRNSNESMPIQNVAKFFYLPAGPVMRFSLGLYGEGTSAGKPGAQPNFPNGSQVVELEVDPDTGVVTIDRFFSVDDVGKALNPMICEGQIHGGCAQGLGQALCEEVVYDDEGQLISGSFMDYCLPRAEHMPTIRSKLIEIPSQSNPLGVKGIGESGTIGTPAAIVNAVLDAVRPAGVLDIDMPVTPGKLWDALHAAHTQTQ